MRRVFTRVSPDGADVYKATFANGAVVIRIRLADPVDDRSEWSANVAVAQSRLSTPPKIPTWLLSVRIGLDARLAQIGDGPLDFEEVHVKDTACAIAKDSGPT